jgi:hypothetical protein
MEKRKETIEEFLKRGGYIKKCGAHDDRNVKYHNSRFHNSDFQDPIDLVTVGKNGRQKHGMKNAFLDRKTGEIKLKRKGRKKIQLFRGHTLKTL